MKKGLIILILCSMAKVEAQTSAFAVVDSLLQIGRYKKALFTLEKIPPTFASNKKIALVYELVDNHKKASIYYEKALQLKKDYATKIKLGKSYKKQKKLIKAIQVFEEIVATDAENLLIQYQLGKLYLQTKKPIKAKTIFQNLIKADPSNANYSYQLGLCYALLKKRNLKINLFLDAYKKDNEHIKAIELLAMAFTRLRDRDSASIFIEKGLRLHPKNTNLNKLKINDLFIHKKYKEAIVLLKHIDSLQPNEHYTQKMLGKSFLNIEEYQTAKTYFEKAKKIDRNDFKTYTYLGRIYKKLNNLEKARLHFTLATFIGKEPRDDEYFELALLAYDAKKPKIALKNFKKATEENSKNRDALFWLARLSDDYYKDKKIGYELFKKYSNRFEGKDSIHDKYVNNRISIVRKEYFLKGINLK